MTGCGRGSEPESTPDPGASGDERPVRRATSSDRSALVALQRHLPERSPDLLDYGIVVGDVLVATEADVPVGYLLPVRGDGAHVAELAVAPEHRREGRATALLDALFDSLPAGAAVTVAVSPDNGAALALYEGRGFAVEAEREGYFASGPALLLSRTV